jgi:hypothetical protein
VSSNSAADLATTIVFSDSPLTLGIFVKAVHLSQLRTAVNAVRLLAALPAATFSDAATPGTEIRAVHATELRSSLDAARGALGLTTGGYTDGSLTGVVIRAVHFQELRDASTTSGPSLMISTDHNGHQSTITRRWGSHTLSVQPLTSLLRWKHERHRDRQ